MNTRGYLSGIFLLIASASVACGPSQVELDATSTQIAANIFATQTAAAPTPTLTPTHTREPTRTPTATPTPSAAPETLIQDHPDGSRSFVDRKGGYTITFPPGWIILELMEGDFDEMMSAAAEEFPDLRDVVNFATLVSQGFRIYALSTDPDIFVLETPPNVSVLITDAPPSMSLDLIVRTNVQSVPQLLPEAEVLSSELITNSKGVPLGTIAYKFSLTSDDAASASIFIKLAMTQIEDTLVIFTGGGSEALSAELEPIFDTIFDNIELIGS